MSNLLKDSAPSSSLDECPIIDGRRQIQHVAPRVADIGGIHVSRVLPSRHRRMVGAWCFLDHAGPALFKGDSRGMLVGPHPHTGLQTFTWMIKGEVLHRDSLGSEQVIRPGQVNLMTAGRGISHIEESVEGERHLHAAQLWIALPRDHRHTEPRFDHYSNLPQWQEQGAELTLLVGEFNGYRAPTLTFSELVGVDISTEAATRLTLTTRRDFEYAILPLEGELAIHGEHVPTDELAYLGGGLEHFEISLSQDARVLLIGGEPLDDEILIWWNFVGHSKQEIAKAQRDWEMASERFGEITSYRGKRMMPPPLPWKV